MDNQSVETIVFSSPKVRPWQLSFWKQKHIALYDKQ